MATSLATSRRHLDSARATLDTVHEGPVTGAARPGQELAAQLRVRRQDIEFQDVGSGRVEIAITVTNAGSSPSRGEFALIQSATLGAFVAWRPLTIVEVPVLQPGESVVLRSGAVRATPKPLETPDRLPPARLLTALGFGDDEPRSPEARGDARVSRALGLFRKFRPLRDEAPKDGYRSLQLPPSPFDLLTGQSTYWAGNLNVFIGGRAVERHRANALRILPEHTNVVMFVVGGDDSYRFNLLGLDSNWEATLFNPMSAPSLSRGLSQGDVIDLGTWVPMHCTSLVFMALRPPANCREANVEVQVTRRSTQETAVVEFSFDASAAGPGCYVVE
jgi:hypothetical protein